MFMCLVCTNVTQVLQHLFLRSPSNSLLMRSLESRCGPRSAGDSPQIWLEIALTELRAPLLGVMTNTWTLDSGLVSGGHSRVCHHIRRPQPGLTRNALYSTFWLGRKFSVPDFFVYSYVHSGSHILNSLSDI